MTWVIFSTITINKRGYKCYILVIRLYSMYAGPGSLIKDKHDLHKFEINNLITKQINAVHSCIALKSNLCT